MGSHDLTQAGIVSAVRLNFVRRFLEKAI